MKSLCRPIKQRLSRASNIAEKSKEALHSELTLALKGKSSICGLHGLLYLLRNSNFRQFPRKLLSETYVFCFLNEGGKKGSELRIREIKCYISRFAIEKYRRISFYKKQLIRNSRLNFSKVKKQRFQNLKS